MVGDDAVDVGQPPASGRQIEGEQLLLRSDPKHLVEATDREVRIEANDRSARQEPEHRLRPRLLPSRYAIDSIPTRHIG